MKGMFEYEGAYAISNGNERSPFRTSLVEIQTEWILGASDIGESESDTFVAPLEFFMVT